MDYKVVITVDAENDFIRHIRYILEKFYNDQAAKSVVDDFEETKNSLAKSAGSLQYCVNPRLRALGYKRINYRMNYNKFLAVSGKDVCNKSYLLKEFVKVVLFC